MTDDSDPDLHVKPFVHDSLTHKALHFSISEIQSRMLLADPYLLDLEYTRTMMGFVLFNPKPERIAMLGLGGGSLAKFCYRHLPHARIEVVEINPHVIALRDEFLVPADDQRFHVMRIDGARFVRDCPERFDVLMVDGFDDQGQAPQLASQSFYDDCRDALRPGAVVVVNLHQGHRHHDRHVERIRRSFDGEMLLVDDGEGCNSVVFACKDGPLRLLGIEQATAATVAQGLAAKAARSLAAAFARIVSAARMQSERAA
jgi:spermidine synthase